MEALVLLANLFDSSGELDWISIHQGSKPEDLGCQNTDDAAAYQQNDKGYDDFPYGYTAHGHPNQHGVAGGKRNVGSNLN